MMQLPFYASIDDVRAAARACQACGRSRQRSQVVFGAGDPAADLMLVAEYPSQTDDRTGQPFTGPAGDFLDVLLAECGISREQLWITNVARCYSTESGRPDGRIRGVTRREREACRVWMDLELQFIDPQVILAIGASAATAMIAEDFRLTEQRGQWFHRADCRWVIATFQPAYIMRMQTHDPDRVTELRTMILEDIQKAAQRAGVGASSG